MHPTFIKKWLYWIVFGRVIETYQISNGPGRERFGGYGGGKGQCAKESRAPVGNRRRKWQRNRIAWRSCASCLPWEPQPCSHFCCLLSRTLCLFPCWPIFGIPLPLNPTSSIITHQLSRNNVLFSCLNLLPWLMGLWNRQELGWWSDPTARIGHMQPQLKADTPENWNKTH